MTKRIIAYYAVGSALTVVLLLLIFLAWKAPMYRALVNGEVFHCEFQYVDSPCSHGDSFRVWVNRIFFLFMIHTVVILPLLYLWRFTASPFTGIRRVLYIALGTALSVVPIATAALATIMVARLTIDMGVTTMRIFGISVGVICTMVFPIYLYGRFRNHKETKAEQSVPGYPPQGVGSPEP
jgi:hypothetical protein